MLLTEIFEALYPSHKFAWRMRGGTSAMGKCPFHSDKTPSLSIYTDGHNQERWYCFAGCGSGTAVNAVMKAQNCTFLAANKWLKDHNYLEETEKEQEIAERDEFVMRFYNWTHTLLNSEDAKPIVSYIVSRGIMPETLADAPVGYYPSIKRVHEWISENNIPSKYEPEFFPQNPVSKAADGGIIFFYRTAYDSFARMKVRNVLKESKGGDKKITMLGKSRPKEEDYLGGYFSWSMHLFDSSKAVIVEGEFDAAGISSICYKQNPTAREPIFCFSGTKNVLRGISLLEQMGRPDCFVFLDNDTAGRLAIGDVALKVPYCSIIEPVDYLQDEDPADWAKRHGAIQFYDAVAHPLPATTWVCNHYCKAYNEAEGDAREQTVVKRDMISFANKLRPTDKDAFIKLMAAAMGCDTDALREEVMESDGIGPQYRKVYSGPAYGIQMNTGNERACRWEQLSNVIFDLDSDIIYDDGSPVKVAENRIISLRARTLDREMTIKVSADEWADPRKFRVVLTAALGSSLRVKPRNWDLLQDAVLQLSRVKEPTIVYKATGWRGDRYYMTNCVVDREGYHDDEDHNVELAQEAMYNRNYFFAPIPEDLEPAKKLIREDILQIFPYSVTLPFIAHIFLSPLRHFLPGISPCSLWLVGVTGTFKTAFTGVMMSFFGNFTSGNFESWRSTVNAIAERGYYLKDAPFVVDDFKRGDVSDKNVATILQTYGNQQAKGRMTSTMKNRVDHPIRGNLIVTAEDTIVNESSSVARSVILRVGDRGNTTHLTNAQKHINLLPGVMAGFIQWLCTQNIDAQAVLKKVMDLRGQLDTKHPRTAEALAVNSVAWEYLSKYLGLEDLLPKYKSCLGIVEGTMDEMTEAEQAGTVFVRGVQDLLADGTCYLQGIEEMAGVDTPHKDSSHLIGFLAPNFCYLLAATALKEVNNMNRIIYGAGLKYSANAIYSQLKLSGALVPAVGSTRLPMVKTIEGHSKRVLRLKRGVVEGVKEDEDLKGKAESSNSTVRDSTVLPAGSDSV